eukprot:CAMPEP_0116091440 /NCGR_PEP_ID=MMETSP0327-20121206/7508_1 /TAXON_ID=44447 /ORGANISM="Pseudo-nitzschia delicatissima, Strain B596" /LENGTH=211 /DNA_ID=CAMNT_0003582795 /DNA_START=117 /DNA_END=751 /DNA_ORIENTATION=-
MWKPGTEKPSGSLLSKSNEKKKKKGSRPNLDLSINDGGGAAALSLKAKSPSSATPRKRLSGGTMNMRFMKRRKSDIDGNKNGESEKPTPASQTKLPSHKRLQNNDAMDIESDNDDASEKGFGDESKYAAATSVDMYGIEASLIGRRSFRGFNAPIERIWKDSKGRLENRGLNDRPGKKVSDEELLQRYKDIARERGSRGVGNLDKKNKKRR